MEEDTDSSKKRGRGRPSGSKNKPKVEDEKAIVDLYSTFKDASKYGEKTANLLSQQQAEISILSKEKASALSSLNTKKEELKSKTIQCESLLEKESKLAGQLKESQNTIKILEEQLAESKKVISEMTAKLSNLKISLDSEKKRCRKRSLSTTPSISKKQVRFAFKSVRKSVKPNISLEKKGIANRAKQLSEFMSKSQGLSNENKVKVVKKLVHRDMNEHISFTPHEMMKFQIHANLKASQVNNMRSFCKSSNKWIQFSNEHFIRDTQQKELQSIFRPELWDYGVEKISAGKGKNLSNLGFCLVNNFAEFLNGILKRYLDNGKLTFPWQWPSQTILIVIYGDHGRGMIGSSGEGTYKEAFCIANAVVDEPASVHQFHIFAVFEGVDSLANLQMFLAKIHEKISFLNGTKFIYGEEEFTLEFSFLFDLARLSHQVGHQGASSTFPSPIDLVELPHLRKHSEQPHTPQTCIIQLRTPESYIENFNKNLISSGSDINLGSQGKYHQSISTRPLATLSSIDQLLLPYMHCQMGVGQDLLEKLKSKLMEVNLVNPEEVAQNNREIEHLEKVMEQSNNDMKEFGKVSLLLSRIKTSLYKTSNEIMQISKENNPSFIEFEDNECPFNQKTLQECDCKCNAENCFFRWPDWICSEVSSTQCDKCEKWIHNLCDPSLVLEKPSPYECLTCKGMTVETLESMISELAIVLNSKQSDSLTKYSKAQSKILQLKRDVNKHLICVEIQKAFDKIKITPQSYHGGALNGRDMKKLINDPTPLLSLFPSGNNFGFDITFDQLKKISEKVTVKKFFSPDEVKELQEMCSQLGILWHQHFSKSTIRPKLHEIIFNLPRLVQRYQTYGIFFAIEEQGESIHRIFAEKLRNFCHVGNRGVRLFKSIQALSLHSNQKALGN